MAAITDLTFQQVLDKSPSNSIVVSDGTTALPSGTYINLGTFLGQSVSGLSSTGVVEFASKFLQRARNAQTTVNTNQAVGEALNAFPNPVANTPTVTDTGISQLMSYSVQVNLTATLDVVSAPNV